MMKWWRMQSSWLWTARPTAQLWSTTRSWGRACSWTSGFSTRSIMWSFPSSFWSFSPIFGLPSGLEKTCFPGRQTDGIDGFSRRWPWGHGPLLPEFVLKVDYGRYMYSIVFYYLTMILSLTALGDRQVKGALEDMEGRLAKKMYAPGASDRLSDDTDAFSGCGYPHRSMWFSAASCPV